MARLAGPRVHCLSSCRRRSPGNLPERVLSWSLSIADLCQPGRLIWGSRVLLAMGATLLSLSGCVRSYQPLTGLHDPVVVDPGARNFPELSLHVYCVPGKALKPAQASVLCQRVGLLFENQGAAVETFVEDPALGSAIGGAGGGAETSPADLVLALEVDAVQKSLHPVTAVLCYFSITIVPMVRETTFSQQVGGPRWFGLSSGDGSVPRPACRAFRSGGLGGNWVLDRFIREPEERLTGEAASTDLSNDLYRQLSQLVFNARMRQEALQLQAPVRTGGAMMAWPQMVSGVFSILFPAWTAPGVRFLAQGAHALGHLHAARRAEAG